MKNAPPVEHRIVVLQGGLDLVTPSLSLPAGYVTDSQNFECSTDGGYAKVKGYERYDGRPSPSAAVVTTVEVMAFINIPSVNQTLTGATSGATGVIIAIGASFVALTKVVGTFTTTEVVQVGATVIGTATATVSVLSSQSTAIYLDAAASQYRSDITAVGGAASSGPARGFSILNDERYAFRDNVGGTATELWKATSGGWSKITFPFEITFDTSVGTGIGNAIAPAEGATMTGGTSGSTAVLRRVMLSRGAWKTSPTATADGGRFIITAPSGAYTVGETVTFTGGATAIVRTVGTQITLATGGKFEMVVGNFFGQLGSLRIYGCDGVNRAFEFDGTYFCPITTGASPDAPKHIVVHKNFLFISIASSVFYSEVGLPYRWATGGEIATGDTVTGLLVQPGSQATGALAVFARSNTFILYGVSPSSAISPFNFVSYNSGAGAIDYSQQNGNEVYYLDDQGIVQLKTTLAYGSFEMSPFSHRIRPFIVRERTKVSSSAIYREKNQYRLFFNDGYGLYLTSLNGKSIGIMPVFFPHIVNVAYEGSLSNGDEAAYFCSTNGFVYQMEKGTSFDGANVDAYITMAWDAANSPRMLKTYKRASIEVRSDTYAEIQFNYQLGYGSSEIEPSVTTSKGIAFQGAVIWDAFQWDNFQWDGSSLLPTEIDMTGSGENVQVTMGSSGTYIDSYSINSVIYHFAKRRFLR